MKEPLRKQEPKLILPGLRVILLKIHADLFTIDRRIQRHSKYYPEYLTNLEKMAIVSEDRRFMSHRGVDVRAIIRELFKAVTWRKHGGASTIDMQFVRTATGYRSRTIRRKLYEIFLSLIIQFRYDKVTILRSYLACAFFGSHIKGAASASRVMYNKSADDLSIDEASVIASMLVYPRPLSAPLSWKSNVEGRAQYTMRFYLSNKKRFDRNCSPPAG
jgi:membrane peptidoglycan carboxypeptidase